MLAGFSDFPTLVRLTLKVTNTPIVRYAGGGGQGGSVMCSMLGTRRDSVHDAGHNPFEGGTPPEGAARPIKCCWTDARSWGTRKG